MKPSTRLLPCLFGILALLSGILSCNGAPGGNWAVQIDNETISMDEFNRYYYTQNKLMFNLDSDEEIDKLAEEADSLNPQVRQYVVKASFLDHLVAQKLLYKKAMNDNTMDKNELNAALELAKMQTASSYFLRNKFKNRITITDEEVERFYTENRNMFRGVPLNENVINSIKQQIFAQKSGAVFNEYIMDVLAESKVNKEGFRNYIQSNQDKPTGNEQQ